ncbi:MULTISPECIES: phytanoyl-CoA dioxygenase family protein [unclassified Spirosoma]|uniref:phytanoyl-CoA dioxygenase family protein n=1 Tax=unclassified Spirosoma TaxID=2621999 RepID=UPI00095B1F88|nr:MULTISPECIES: phytanoyl-CoA dioxygenase family protein [unclassified Spirosoma]MBN8825684.1 phytanoyl-CoA dioxygenase family protein [Spirosoma sp.]OJW76621.1 MAG: phytanoyl-CoA dioxygenase family protein [Spirosoma sp. 48-14]
MKPLTSDQIQQYQRDGYLIIRHFLTQPAIDRLYQVAIDDQAISKHAINVNDSTGKRSKLSLWYQPGNDSYGLLTRSQRMVESVDKLLDGEAPVCHFHSKLMQKEPRVGGAWEWHQDYGYWYKNEFLLPDQMMSVMMAITDANRENGCLQVIKGSHKMGRVEHGLSGEQVGAAQRYVELALETMELEFVELKAGDALFFHSNLLHRSEANLSDKARWSLISCYNRQSNIGYKESSTSTSSITPITVVADDALLTQEAEGLAEEAADFLAKEADVALQ